MQAAPEGIDTIECPSGSHDLNPMEHLWDIVWVQQTDVGEDPTRHGRCLIGSRDVVEHEEHAGPQDVLAFEVQKF